MYDVIFCQPSEFKRTKNGTNPFFDPLLRICEKRDLSYLVLDINGFLLTSSSPYITFFFRLLPVAVLLLQKIQTWLGIGKNIAERERLIGRLLRLVSFGQLYAPVYVTIAGAMDLVFCGMYKKSTVCDLQHGIIYPEHDGYFENKCLREHLNYPNIHFLVYGKGYKKFFKTGVDDNVVKRVHVIGDVMRVDQKQHFLGPTKNIVFCSLQMTPDSSVFELEEMKKVWENFLLECERLDVCGRYRVVFKHHPRFRNCMNLSDIGSRFPFVEWCNDMDSVSANMFLHVTIMSTVAFDVAVLGVPTCFLSGMCCMNGSKLFRDEFNYPFKRSFKEWIDRYQIDHVGYMEDGRLVKEWFYQYYEIMDNERAFQCLKGNFDFEKI